MRSGRVSALAIGAGLLLTAASPAGAQGLDACRQIQDPQARLACYDGVAGQPAAPFPGPDSPRVGASRPAAPGMAAPPVAAPSPEQKFGAESVRQPTAARAAPPRPQQLEALTATVANVRQSGLGRVALTLDNGQVWQQTETVRLNLDAGDRVTIERGLLGSYNLVPAGGSRLFKVERVR